MHSKSETNAYVPPKIMPSGAHNDDICVAITSALQDSGAADWTKRLKAVTTLSVILRSRPMLATPVLQRIMVFFGNAHVQQSSVQSRASQFGTPCLPIIVFIAHPS
jgi:hypothetical protein